MGEKKIKDYTVKENEDYYDLVDEPSYKLYFSNAENRQNEEGTLRVLSLFSGLIVIYFVRFLRVIF